MGLKLIKKGRRLKYQPLPKESPETAFYYIRMSESDAKVLREKCGRQFFNKQTGRMDFEVLDEVAFNQEMLSKVLVGWEGFFEDSDDPVPRALDFSEAPEYFETLALWIKLDIAKRAMGVAEEADIENLLVHKETEEGAKKY